MAEEKTDEGLGYRFDAPMLVQTSKDGWVYGLAGSPQGDVIFVFNPDAADETGRRLIAAARRVPVDPAALVGEVAGITIEAPVNPLSTALLQITMTEGVVLDLKIDLRDLLGLSQTAAEALAAVEAPRA